MWDGPLLTTTGAYLTSSTYHTYLRRGRQCLNRSELDLSSSIDSRSTPFRLPAWVRA